MREPRVGVGIIIIRDGHRLLLMRRRGDHGGGTWSTPGGHLDFGEDPIACGRREAFEETGVEVEDVQFIGVTNDVFTDTDRHYVTIWVEGRPAGGEAFLAAPDEATEVGWFDHDELPSPLFLPLRNVLAGRMLSSATDTLAAER